ncbi:MAG: PBP1A family penicillin-binding protein [Clostridia bacterium]|nr:PBP1A family penicillin-binding protein [Clostridia bacterium]
MRWLKRMERENGREDARLLRRLEGKRKRHIFRKLMIAFAVALAGGAAAGYFIFDVPNWQKLDLSKITSVQQTGAVYDRWDNEIAALKGSQDRTVVALSSLPEHVKNAFLAAEDLRFYSHSGFDPVRIVGAALANLRAGSYSEGASTITQQLIKLTHLSSEKTIARKLEEIALAIQLERACTKDEILEMYLNYVYFGRGAYGVEAASRSYFGVGASELTAAQAASLAAIVKAPALYSPGTNPENNASRRAYILDVMRENDLLTAAEYEAATAEELAVLPAQEQENPYGWYTDAVLDEAEQILGISGDALLGGGYRIYTALDPEYQRIADEQYARESNFAAAASDGERPQSAMACVDAGSGAVLCVVGGREYTVQRGLNRATQMRRQPGSALKPLAVYAPAIEYYGATTATVLNDTPTTFAGGYTPRNSGNSYHGFVTVREALKWSMNVAAVSMLDRIGVAAGRAYLEKVGIPLTDSDWGLSLALGSLTYGVSPVQLAAAYAAFGNGGTYYEPYFIRAILDAEGNVLYTHTRQGTRVLSEETAYLMNSLLQSVTASGTGAKLSGAGTPVAGKTGTVNMTGGGNRDIWMAAYNREIATAFWMGFDRPDSAHKLAGWVSGGDYTAALATGFFKAAYAGKEKPAFDTPAGIVWQTVDRASVEWLGEAMLATSLTPKAYQYSEVFAAGNKLSKQSTAWKAPSGPSAFYVTHNDKGNPVLCITAQESALLRVQRDCDGESLVLTELNGKAGETVYYADATAKLGVVYTYRVTPINYELLQNGILLEGTQLVQIAQARAPSAGNSIWNTLRRMFGGGGEEASEASIFQNAEQ